MKILYLSCHSILEYDELKLFEELGHEYFSLGSYLDPQNPVDQIRPALNQKVRSYWYDRAPNRNKIPKDFVEDFDVIIVMHIPEWITDNWENIKHKRVIWRTIGQSDAKTEAKLAPYRAQGLQIVRYSPKEESIQGNAGCDAIIRFYKDPNEFNFYNGTNKRAITIAQNMKHRAEFCNYDTFTKIVEGVPAKLYGPNNENAGELNGGFLTYEEMKQTYRDNRVYIYTGTQPASYTLNFIEAFMTGIPVVAIGPKYGNSLHIGGDLYEVADLIQNGITGYVSDDIEFLRNQVIRLLENPREARLIGERGRMRAIELFGKDSIKLKWSKFLNEYHN